MRLRSHTVLLAAPLLIASGTCPRQEVARIGGTTIWQVNGALIYTAGLDVDADGAAEAYSPDGKGLDHLANAGHPGNWWGVVTENGRPDGNPVIQKAGDPAPGYYVSSTSLQDSSRGRTDPRRYVDASEIPYVVLPPGLKASKKDPEGPKLGDLAAVIHGAQVAFAIFADVGPSSKIGEGSIALARNLGIAADPKHGGTGEGVTYVVFPGSGNGGPRTAQDIATEGQRLLREFGGVDRVRECTR